MKYDVFVFSGQSNMMGASVIPPKQNDECHCAYEYHYNPKRRGNESGVFIHAKHPAGEWSYIDVESAYSSGNMDLCGKSIVTDYLRNTYFVPAMAGMSASGNVLDFASFSESTAIAGQSIPPYFAERYAGLGHSCIYAHMAKGCVSIDYYLNNEVKSFFADKYRSMLEDFRKLMLDCTVGSRNFVWCQGETDAEMSTEAYKEKLRTLWAWLKSIGLENFFIIRVGYWGTAAITNIMAAQEEFCEENSHCYIVTRAESFMPWPGMDINTFYIIEPAEEYLNCRDSYFGYDNEHINCKGNILIAMRAADNISRILYDEQDPILEEENVAALRTAAF